jgi:membrane protein implicated in regulation of membrane protease activity
MAHSSNPRAKILIFIAVLALSALTMLWLFWRYPLGTSIGAVAVVAALWASARLAHSVKTDDPATDESEHSI